MRNLLLCLLVVFSCEKSEQQILKERIEERRNEAEFKPQANDYVDLLSEPQIETSPSTFVIAPEEAEKIISQRMNNFYDSVLNKNFDELRRLINPEEGIFVFPYHQPRLGEMQVFTSIDIHELFTDEINERIWGEHYHSYQPIKLTPKEYYNNYIKLEEQNIVAVSYNEYAIFNNEIETIWELFPDSIVVTYYFDETDPFDSIWRGVRFLWLDIDGVWYLSGILYDSFY
jgi:hypothetical protein